MYSTKYILAISLRSQGKNIWLLIGRGYPVQGLWQHTQPPPSSIRTRDFWLEYLRKHLEDQILTQVHCDKQDRSFLFETYKSKQLNFYGFFYSGRETYFFHLENKNGETHIFYSWKSKEVNPKITFSIEDYFDLFNEVGRRELLNLEITSAIFSGEEIYESEKKLLSSFPENNSQKNKITKIKIDLERIKKWRQLAQSISSLEIIPDNKCVIEGISFNFNRQLNFHQKIDLIYQKIKRLKKAEIIQEERLKKEEAHQTPTKVSHHIALRGPLFSSHKKNTSPIKNQSQNYTVIQTDSCSCAIGLNAQGNDELRNNWAHKDDWWFHLEDETSPHIILKLKTKTLDIKTIKEIANIMRAHLKKSDEPLSLIYTQVKNLKGVKGKAGAVTVKKEKHIKI